MLWVELDKEICLTCHYWDVPRKITATSNSTYLYYDQLIGSCKMAKIPNRTNHTQRAGGAYGCRYKRWVDLPDKKR